MIEILANSLLTGCGERIAMYVMLQQPARQDLCGSVNAASVYSGGRWHSFARPFSNLSISFALPKVAACKSDVITGVGGGEKKPQKWRVGNWRIWNYLQYCIQYVTPICPFERDGTLEINNGGFIH